MNPASVWTLFFKINKYMFIFIDTYLYLFFEINKCIFILFTCELKLSGKTNLYTRIIW